MTRTSTPHALPFPHIIIDDFFSHNTALQLEREFPPYDAPEWVVYSNALENKKTQNHWNMFPPTTYKAFQHMCGLAPEGTVADYGLHGAGWHMHGSGGNLNPHLDYSTHPKLGRRRCYNLIVYLASDYKAEYGGHLGLWSNGILQKAIVPLFNRAVLFDTRDNVHGLASPFIAPENVYRKSMAIYYVGEPAAATRTRALFFTRPEQVGDAKVEALIERRAKGEYV